MPISNTINTPMGVSVADTNPTNVDNISSGYLLGQEWFNRDTGDRFFHKTDGIWVSYISVAPAIDGSDSPVVFEDYATTHSIIIATSSNITTSTTNINGYGQHGRNTIIDNGSTPISLTCMTSSNSFFVSSYTKLGSAPISFVAGSGITLVQVDGTLVMNGVTGSTACLTRNYNTYYLQISNR